MKDDDKKIRAPLELARAQDALVRALKTYGNDRVELEFRLGHRVEGKFVPGVSERAWSSIKQRLDASVDKFKVVVATTEERICDGDRRNGTAKYVVPGQGAPFWMHKKRLSDTDMNTTAGPWCCRASLSLEEVDPPGAAPPPGTHRFQRHKQRWSYVHRCWSIDLTRVTSNLPHQLDNDDVSYEIEIELRDTTELFARPLDNVLLWGWTMACDLCAMAAAS